MARKRKLNVESLIGLLTRDPGLRARITEHLVLEKPKMRRKRKQRKVRVVFDGETLIVPERADCLWAARGALGLPRGVKVGYVGSTRELDFQNGHTFKSGDAYQTLYPTPVAEDVAPPPAEAAASNDEDDVDEDGDEHAPWERDPSWWRR